MTFSYQNCSLNFNVSLISDQGEIYSQWSDWSPCDPDNSCQKMRQRFCSQYNNIKCPEANVYGVHNEYDRCSASECYRKFVTVDEIQKKPSRGVHRKRCPENMQQIFRRTPMPRCNFNKLLCNFIEIALRHGCSPANLLHIFRTHFPDNTSGGLFLKRPDLIPNVTSYICSTYFMKNTINYSKLFTSISHFLLVSLSWQCCQSFLVFGFLECIKHSN